MKRLLPLLLVSFLGFACLPLLAQVHQTAYAEVPVDKKAGSDFKVLLAPPEQGLLCFLESEIYQKQNQKELQLRYFGDTLQLLWEKTYMIHYLEAILYDYYSDGKGYFLTRKKEDEYRVLEVDLASGNLSAMDVTPIKNLLITDFKVHEKQLFMGGRVNNHPLVVMQRFGEGVSGVVLPSITQLDAELLHITIDTLHNEVYVILEKERPISERGVYINRYSMDGTMLENEEIRFSTEYHVLSFLPLPGEKAGELMLYGTYGLGHETNAQGIYNMRIAKGQIADNRFYDFGYLKNFFNYLPEKVRKRKTKKVKAMLESGKRMKHRYKLFVHKLQVVDGRVVFMAESYEASSDRREGWGMPGTSGYGSWYDPSLRRYMNALGYNGFMPMSFSRNRFRDRSNFPTSFEYKHAIVLGFDENGLLKWDNSFTFQSKTKSDFPLEQAQVVFTADTAIIMQAEEDELYFKVAAESHYVDTLDTLKIPLPFPDDEYLSFEYGGMLNWYGRHCITSGIREIRNKHAEEKKRHVFFLARYSYAPHLKEKDALEEEEDE